MVRPSLTSLLLALLLGCGGGGSAPATPDAAAAVDAGPDDAAPIDATPAPNGNLLLTGTIITPDEVIDGQLLVVGDTISCVAAGTGCADAPGAAGATSLAAGGIIAPGLIDTHNHILFDIFDGDDWLPAQVYQNHDQWPNEARYAAMMDVKQCLENASQGKPAWCAATPYGSAAGSVKCEMDKWGELKGLIAGTTSIVGLPGTSAKCFGSLARSVDVAQNGLGQDTIRTSALFPPSKATADSVCAAFAAGTTEAFLIHCGEGVDARSLAEFATLGSVSTTPGCLYAPQTTITHGVAFTATEFATMAAAGMKLTWSPASNLALYGVTADIPAALDAGLVVALAPDWSMGGSQNLLDELRVAAAWDAAHWGGRLAAKNLVGMVTTNAAAVLALGDRLGQIKEGYLADLIVVAGDAAAPYDAILAATPREVRLVMVGGQVLYGDAELAPLGPAQPGCEALDVCGAAKFACVATATATDKLGQPVTEIQAALEAALVAADAQTPGDGWSFAPLAPLVRCP